MITKNRLFKRPCKNFPTTNGNILMSDFAITLYTWKCIEIPANPNKNDVQINLVIEVVPERLQIKEAPLVNSKNPLKKLETRAGSIFNNVTMGRNILAKNVKKLTLFSSLITTEKNIIKPAILMIVLIDDVIAFVKILIMLEFFGLEGLQHEFARYCFFRGQIWFLL